MKLLNRVFPDKSDKKMFTTGVIILSIVMIFVFIVPMFYPYKDTDIFYANKKTTVKFGEIGFNEQFLFYPVNPTCELPEEFFGDFENAARENPISSEIIIDDESYISERIIDDLYTVSKNGNFIGVVSQYVIDFFDVSFGLSVSDSSFVEIFLTADKDLNVYDINGKFVGTLTKSIVRGRDGKDSFTYEQKTELRRLSEEVTINNNDATVYSETLNSELLVYKNGNSAVFYRYENKMLIDMYSGPSESHLLGTDANGMDVLARLMYGGRISIAVGFFASLAGVIIGTLLGCWSGLKSGITDMILMRGIDIFDSIPTLPVLLILGGIISDVLLPSKVSVAVMIAIIALFGWSQTARIIRMSVMKLNSDQNSVAFDLSGITPFRKILVLIFPKIFPQITSLVFMGVGSAIMTEATMSYLGFGIGFPYSGWGIMLNDSTTVNELGAHPYIWISTALAICITVVGFYLLGESFIKEKVFENYFAIGNHNVCEHIRTSDRTSNILEIENLSLSFSLNDKIIPAVKDFSLSLRRGEIVSIVGPSGCGKSVTADAVTGLLSANCVVKTGRIVFRYLKRSKCKIGYVLQEPMSCFNPIISIGKQLEEFLMTAYPKTSKSEAYEKVIQMIKCVGFPNPDDIYNTYPEQLSGGMCQRLMIAGVLLQTPELIIADEPCSSLDTHFKLVILDLLKTAVKNGASLIMITHNIHEAEYMSDNIVKITSGDALEDIRENANELSGNDSFNQKEISLVVQGISKTYRDPKRIIKALDNVTFSLNSGKILGIIGNEGSGKTTLAEVIAGIKNSDCGKIVYNGLDITNMSNSGRRKLKGKIQLIFQHPYNSLTSGICVGRQIREVLHASGQIKRCDEYRNVIELMKECGLSEDIYYRNIDTLSGGQCKRVCIARAIASNPDILICDEPLAYLDTELHVQIVELLKNLNKKYKMSMIFISHDLDSLMDICDEIMVLHDGCVVEYGLSDNVLSIPESEHCRKMIEEMNLLKNNVSQSKKE